MELRQFVSLHYSWIAVRERWITLWDSFHKLYPIYLLIIVSVYRRLSAEENWESIISSGRYSSCGFAYLSADDLHPRKSFHCGRFSEQTETKRVADEYNRCSVGCWQYLVITLEFVLKVGKGGKCKFAPLNDTYKLNWFLWDKCIVEWSSYTLIWIRDRET